MQDSNVEWNSAEADEKLARLGTSFARVAEVLGDPHGHGPQRQSLALLAEADEWIVAVTSTIPSDRIHIVSAQLALDDDRDCYRAGRNCLPCPRLYSPRPI